MKKQEEPDTVENLLADYEEGRGLSYLKPDASGEFKGPNEWRSYGSGTGRGTIKDRSEPHLSQKGII